MSTQASFVSPALLDADIQMMPLDIRAAVVAHFKDFGDAPVSGQVAKFVAIARPRLLSVALMVLQAFAVHLPVLVISGSDRNSNNDIFRALSMVAALFVNCFALITLGRPVTHFHTLQRYCMLNFLCLVLEMSMFHLGTNHHYVIFFGILGMLLRFALMSLAALMLRNAHQAGAATEETYTRYIGTAYVDAMNSGIEKVTAEVTAGCPRSQQEARLIAAHLAHSSHAAAAGQLRRIVANAVSRGEKPKRVRNSGAAGNDSASDVEDDRRAASFLATSVEAASNSLRRVQSLVALGDGNALSSQQGSSVVRSWKVWACASQVRKTLYKRDSHGHSVAIGILVILALLTIGNFTFEFVKIFMNQTPLFSEALNEKYNDPDITRTYMPSRTHTSWKVHMVVVDGMRFEDTEDGASALGSYVHSPPFRDDSYRLEARAQLPSFSVPNWLSLLTGAPPELTGVTGNIGNAETTFDHIYRQAKLYGVHAGMTGTPWWKTLVFSALPPLDGDGTISFSFREEGTPDYPHPTSDPADWARLEVALRAARRSTVASPFSPVDNVTNMYEFFLTHFSDVDAQGHELGIDTKWNEFDSFMGAIKNKTEAIQRLVEAIDEQTVLIITSDHGHVRRGGHGGVPEVLLKVPMIFYAKNSGLRSRVTPPSALLPAESPRSEAGGAYQNLDLSATICALLGIPSPRQSVGVLMEEVVEALLPSEAKWLHYYDLFSAKVHVFRQYREMLDRGVFAGVGQNLDAESVDALLGSWNSTEKPTPRQLMDEIRRLRNDYIAMRNLRERYIWVRNLVCSILLLVPWFLLIVFVFNTSTVVNITSLFDPRSPSCVPNRGACAKAFVTVAFFMVICLAVFLIVYLPITGYTVWDSTLTHAPNVAVRYLVTTIIAPIITFVVLTKLFLLTSIEWKTPQIAAASRLQLSRNLDAQRIGEYLGYIFHDMKTFCLGTRLYKPEKFPEAYLYIYYLALWTCFVTSVLLFLSFPFTWVVPVVFSTEHVTSFNLQHRFRIITMLIIVLPLQVGTVLLLALRPRLTADYLLHWDNLFLTAHLEYDLYCLEAQLTREGGVVNPPRSTNDGRDEVKVLDASAGDVTHVETPASPADCVLEVDLRARLVLLRDCIRVLQDGAFRVTDSDLILAEFY